MKHLIDKIVAHYVIRAEEDMLVKSTCRCRTCEPYRTQPEKEAVVVRPKHGLIFTPKPHVCSPPSYFMRLYYYLRGRPVNEGAVWRCNQCGDTFKWEYMSVLRSHMLWKKVHISSWVNSGGME